MKKYFWSFVDIFQNRGVGLVFSLILANLLPPANIGNYLVLMMVINYSSNILIFKIGSGIIYKLNNQQLEHEHNEYFSAGFFLVLINSTLLTLLVFVFKEEVQSIFNVERIDLMNLVIPLIFLSAIRQYLNGVLRSKIDFKFLAINQFIINSIGYSIIIYLIINKTEISYIFKVQYFINLVLIIAYSLKVFKQYHLQSRIKGDVIIKLLKFSGWLQLAAIAVFLDKNIDIFLINRYLEKDDVAIYNYALKLSLLLLIISNAVSGVTYPKLTILFSTNNIAEIKHQYRIHLVLTFSVFMMVTFLVISNIEWLVLFILPSEYLQMVLPLTIIMLTLAFFASYSSMGTLMTSMGRPGLGTIPSWLAVGVNITFSILLVPILGILGAAIATSSSFLLRVFIQMYYERKYLKSGFNHLNLFFFYILFISVFLFAKYYNIFFGYQLLIGFLCSMILMLVLIRGEARIKLSTIIGEIRRN